MSAALLVMICQHLMQNWLSRRELSEVKLNKLLQSKGFEIVRLRLRSLPRSECSGFPALAQVMTRLESDMLLPLFMLRRSTGSVLFGRRRWMDLGDEADARILHQARRRNPAVGRGVQQIERKGGLVWWRSDSCCGESRREVRNEA